MSEKIKLMYFTDAYCPWCHGFGVELTKFLGNHPEIEVEVVAGGLFRGERVQPLPNFREGLGEVIKNTRAFYDVAFKSFPAWFDDANYVMDSSKPANVLGLVKQNTKDAHIVYKFYKLMQGNFYENSADLNNAQSYMPWLKEVGLDGVITTDMIVAALADNSIGEKDFAVAQRFGISTYPNVYVQHKDRWFDLKGPNPISVEGLESNYEAILKQ